MYTRVSSFISLLSLTSGYYQGYCQELCKEVGTCSHDPHAHGSYCKSWQDPPVCFGLYHQKPHGYCFEPNDPHCNDSKLEPVRCGHHHVTTTPTPKGYCQQLCKDVKECREDPHQHGSYCKTWQDVDVCFGLYRKKFGGFCFQPNDPHCDDSKLEPVLCHK